MASSFAVVSDLLSRIRIYTRNPEFRQAVVNF